MEIVPGRPTKSAQRDIDDELWESLGYWMTQILHGLEHRNWSISDDRMTVQSERCNLVLTRKGEVIRMPVNQCEGEAD